MKRFWKDIIALGVFFIIVGVFFYPITQGKLPVPTDTLVGLYHPWRDLYTQSFPRGVPFRNFLITDPIRQQIPWRKIAIDEWKSGRFPLWNPFVFSGTPLLGNIQAGALYPLNIIFFFFSFPVAWTMLIVLQSLLAGLFFYVYARHTGFVRPASLFGAIAWSFCGFSIAWFTWGTIVHVALWLPLILLALDNIISQTGMREQFKWVGVFSFSLVMQLFAGHMQVSLYLLMIVGFYALWKILANPARLQRRNALFMVSAGLLVFVILSSVQWIPFLQLLSSSGRFLDVNSWQKPGWFLPWQHLVQFIIPDFFGNPATLNYWGEWNYGEFIGYIGILPLMFALSALIVHRGKSFVRFWGAVLVCSFAFLLPTPLAMIPYQVHMPLFSSLQPTRLMVIVDFSLVLLAVYAFDAWYRTQKRSWVSMIVPVGVMILMVWGVVIGTPYIVNNRDILAQLLTSKRNMFLPTALFVLGSGVYAVSQIWRSTKMQKVVTFLFISFVALDLLRFGWKFTPFTPASYFFPETKTIEFLKKQSKLFRIMSVDDALLPANTASYYDIEGINGYDPIFSERYEELMAAIERGKPDIAPPFGFNRIVTPKNIDSPLLLLFNVRFVLSLSDISRPFLTKVFQEGETRVYEYTNALPRAYIVDTLIHAAKKQQIIDALYDPHFEPKRFAAVEAQIEVPQAIPVNPDEKVVIEDTNPSRINLKTQTQMLRFVVLSVPWFTGWKATVDEVPVSIYKANYIFMGVVVPAGSHRLVFRYQ